MEDQVPVTGPLPLPDDRVKSMKQFVEFASDLQDSEVRQLARIIVEVSNKFSRRIATVENLEAMRDEILTRTAEIGILATVDVAPILNGEPPTVEIVGRISGTEQSAHGFDHERKQFEVVKSKERGEDWLGQKEAPNATPIRKRFRS